MSSVSFIFSVNTDVMEDTTKKCGSCQQVKDLINFNKCKTGRLGFHNHCRECQTICRRKFYDNNKEYETAKSKLPENKLKAKIKRQENYKDDDYRTKLLFKNKIRRRTEEAKMTQRAYEKMRRQTDPVYNVAKCLRSRTRSAIKKLKLNLNIDINKYCSQVDFLGCSFGQLKLYLESKFLNGMTWENHGYGNDKWHVDHIIPCSSFDLTQECEQRKCFHYNNLQPLWQFDNLSKNDNIL